MPDEYIEVPVEYDETALYNMAVARIQETFPEWTPKKPSMIDIILGACASMAAVGAEVASNVPSNIFRAFGPMAGAPPLDAVSATVMLRFNAIDTNGYTVDAQTPVELSSTTSTEGVGFWTLNDADIPAGQTYVDTLAVAVIPGANGSDLFTVTRIDSLAFINNISLSPTNTASQGGQDAELDDAFDDRLSQEFETWSETPILGSDFALLARKINGVWRCGYIDNYNPADHTYNNDKMVALCPIDINGNAVSSTMQQEVQALMQSLRELNFVCNVLTPTVSVIDISYTGHVTDPTTAALAQGEVQAALATYLNQASWGIQKTQTGEVPVWENDPNIRYSKVMTTIESVQSLAWAEQMKMAIHGNTLGVADIVMPGAFALPNLGTVTATMVSP